MSFFSTNLHHMTIWDRRANLSLPLTSKKKKKKSKPNLGKDILGFLLPGAEHKYVR